jgi:small subunit ribosomal protein S9
MVKDEKAEEDKKKKAVQKPKAKKAAPKEAPKEAPKAEAHKEAPKAEVHKPEAMKPAAVKASAPKPEAHPAPVHKEPKKKKTAHKKVTRAFVARGKRKTSVARATIQAGKGVVRINTVNISAINNPYIREIIREPLRYIGPEANNIDISVNINGGGVMGQAQAARTAIANALVMYFDQMGLKDKFMAIDHSILIDDTRRVETKKFRGPKARARFQKSYR